MIQKNISTLIKHEGASLYKGGSFIVSNNRFANSKIEISNKNYASNRPFPQIKTGFRKLNTKIYVDSLSYVDHVIRFRIFYPFDSFTVFADSLYQSIDSNSNTIDILPHFEHSAQKHVTHQPNVPFHFIEINIESPNQYTYVYIKSDHYIDHQLILIST